MPSKQVNFSTDTHVIVTFSNEEYGTELIDIRTFSGTDSSSCEIPKSNTPSSFAWNFFR
jgi:hypothetical protein